MSIYTRSGDKGETGLLGGGRVPKNDPRVAAYGDVDELNAAIGTAMACQPEDFRTDLLESVQRDLFAIGGQLAAPDPSRVAKALKRAKIAQDRILELESVIDEADGELDPLKHFVLPGGTMKAALLHQARTVCRRAERQVVALAQDKPVPEIIVIYLNRLSDVLFTLARLANHRAGLTDRIW